MSNNNKKLSLFITIFSAMAVVFGFVADGHSTLGIVSDLIKPIGFVLNYGIPFWSLIIMVVALLFSFIYLWNIKLRKFYNKKKDSTLLQNKGQFYTKFQELLIVANEKITVIGLEKYWVFPLFISIFVARKKGVKIDVVYYFDSHERYYLLKFLGCRIFKVPRSNLEDPFEGVICDPEQILNCRAIVHNPRADKDSAFGRHYFGSYDFYAIQALNLLSNKTIEKGKEDYKDESYETLELVKISEEEMLRKMRKVPLYKNARISYEEVKVSDTFPVSSYVVKFKLNQVKEVFRFHEENDWKLFQLCAIKLPNGELSVIVPPVLEEHNGKLYLAEGHSRIYTSLQKGIEKVNAIVVRGVTKDLPLKPTTWNKIQEVDEKNEIRDASLARYVETTIHKNTWIKEK